MLTDPSFAAAARALAAEIAAEIARTPGPADVVATTVHATVGGKPQLIRALTERGVDAGSIEEFLQRLAGLDDGREVVRLTAEATATVTQELLETITLLVDDRTADPASPRPTTSRCGSTGSGWPPSPGGWRRAAPCARG